MHPALTKLLNIRGAKLTLEIVVILLLFVALKSCLQRDLAQGTAPVPQGALLNGEPVSLQSTTGKPVLLYFWATWCAVCKVQHSAIVDISRDYPVISIAMESGSAQDIQNYLHENNLQFPVVPDHNSTIARQYGVSGVPTTFIIDPAGTIAFAEMGYTTEWGLRLRLWLAAR